jgi:hypothetical protein
MKVDPEKTGQTESVDTDQNVYQLALTCQKIFSTIVRSVDKIPVYVIFLCHFTLEKKSAFFHRNTKRNKEER